MKKDSTNNNFQRKSKKNKVKSLSICLSVFLKINKFLEKTNHTEDEQIPILLAMWVTAKSSLKYVLILKNVGLWTL